MKILVTGASGFIGMNLVKFLIANGVDVCCISRSASTLLGMDLPCDRVHVIAGDLVEPETYEKLPKTVDAVIHLAALLGEWKIDEQKILKSNVEMTKMLLEWFSSSSAKHFIFSSTPGVQGFGHRLAKESAPYNPRAIYEKSKMMAEKIIKAHNFTPGQAWTIIRPDFVYGPGDLRRIKLYKRIMKHQWIKIGKGTAMLRPTFVTDVCEAVSMCILNPRAYFEIFNVGGPELISSHKYAEIIAKVLGVKPPSIRLPTSVFFGGAAVAEWISKIMGSQPLFTKSQVEFMTMDHGTDVSKVKELIGFSPGFNFEKGMYETLNWAKNENYL